MPGLRQDRKATQYFSISGDKTRVSLSSAGLLLDGARPGWRREKSFAIPFNKIVCTECKKLSKNSVASHSLLRSIRLSTFSFSLFKRGYRTIDKDYEASEQDSDSLVIHYVEELTHKGLFKLKQISLKHTDSEVIKQWERSIQDQLIKQSSRPKNLLVFINPFGGRGKATSLWESRILPVFQLAGIQSQVIVTKHAGHALSLLQTIPLHGFDGVISVGGDGMFAEVFNGVTIRAAREANLDVNDKTTQFIRPTIRVGFIPGGSTDSISMCLHGTTDPMTAALHIVLGDRMMVDAVSIHSQARLERFAMTMVSYGYFGDLMTHSERYRCLGRSRYSVSGIRTFFAKQSYSGTIRYVAADVDQDRLLGEKCGRGCPSCSEEALGQDTDKLKDDPSTRLRDFEVVGRFIGVTSATLSCSCRHTVPGLSPSAHTGDGATDLIIVHNTFHLNYLRYLFRTAFNLSHPFHLPFVQAVRVRGWSFSPQTDGKHSTWNCDGEVLENAEIFVRSHRQLVPVFARGVYNKKYETERKLTEEAQLFHEIPAF